MECLCQQVAGPEMELSPICIGQLWIFEDLDPEDVAALGENALRKKADKGEQLFRQGDPADEMFLIKGGRIKLTKILEDGSELTVDIRKSGDFVGENMFSEEGLYPVSAWCLEETMTCGFTRAQFESLVLEYPNVGLQIIKRLSDRISRLTSRVGSLAATNIEERLYRVLSVVAKEHGQPEAEGLVIQFPLTHEDLGFLTGAHRVSITRAMKTLKSEGKISIQGRRLVLPYPESA
ncbi:MAG: Crp/Fnr family transcriptional regulator [Desulfobacterales bacterium]|nr:Crp/Fnr family transcriptional regulator [Desulfobacterales bacterium]